MCPSFSPQGCHAGKVVGTGFIECWEQMRVAPAASMGQEMEQDDRHCYREVLPMSLLCPVLLNNISQWSGGICFLEEQICSQMNSA